MTNRLAGKKKVSVSTASRMVKKMGKKFEALELRGTMAQNASGLFVCLFVEWPGESRESNPHFSD